MKKSHDLPKHFFEPMITKAQELLAPTQIVLFGSFARGDAHKLSDIDLAFRFCADQAAWVKFKLWTQENLRTLRALDLVNLEEADDFIKNSVANEGIVLYEQEN